MPLALGEVWRNSILGCGYCQGKFPILELVMWSGGLVVLGLGLLSWFGVEAGFIKRARSCAEFARSFSERRVRAAAARVGCKRPMMPADVVVDPIGTAVRLSWRVGVAYPRFLCVTPASQGTRVNDGLGVTSLCDSRER
jgi:hypothetical protein